MNSPIKYDNIINFLWIDGELSLLEKMCVNSFLMNSYVVKLWTYNKNLEISSWIFNSKESHFSVCDANKIIPSKNVFKYLGNGDCRKNSFGGFSDIFRYELLYQNGGWYCDIDMMCINPFADFHNQEYVFRSHHMTEICGNIIKCPKGSDIMNDCRYESKKLITCENNDWHLPLKILQRNFHKYSLEKYIAEKKYYGNDDSENLIISNRAYNDIFLSTIKKIYKIPYEYAFHWMNEANKNGLYGNKPVDWNTPFPRTVYKECLKKYEINK